MYIDFSSFFDQSFRESAGFYPAKSHEKAFLRISDGLNHNHSVFFLRGAKGVGKTHILKRLYRKPEASLHKAWLSAASPSVSMIMQSFADLYGLQWDSSNPNKLRNRLAEDAKNNHIAVLYIDNVTSLDVETIIKLSNILRWRKQSLGKIVFSGQFKLDSALTMFVKKNDIKSMQSKLYALDEAEVHAYLVQLSRVSGYSGRSPFDRGSVHALIQHSKGIPSKINRLCDFCLFIARTHNHLVLDAGLINKAAKDLKKLNLWTIEDSNSDSLKLDSTLSKQQTTSSDLNTDENFGFHPKKTISVRVAVSKGRPAQHHDAALDHSDKSLSDEWDKAVNSYLVNHPQDKNARVNQQPTKHIFSRPLLLTCLFLSLCVGVLYYLFDSGKHYRDKSIDIFRSESIIPDRDKDEADLSELPATEPGHAQSNERVESALILAVWNNKALEIEQLLQLGVDVNTVNHFGQTPLMIAAMLGNEKIVDLMLKNEASIDVVDNKGLTALMLAARNGQQQVVEFLLNNGANINVQDKHGMTALMHAASFGHQETVEIILRFSPELDLRNTNGQSAGAIAQALGYYNISQILQMTQEQ